MPILKIFGLKGAPLVIKGLPRFVSMTGDKFIGVATNIDIKGHALETLVPKFPVYTDLRIKTSIRPK